MFFNLIGDGIYIKKIKKEDSLLNLLFDLKENDIDLWFYWSQVIQFVELHNVIVGGVVIGGNILPEAYRFSVEMADFSWGFGPL